MSNAQPCYFPDGSISTNDTPCHAPFTDDGASACCSHDDICLDNNLCLAQSGAELISRGTCTDKTWQSPECSQYCSDVNTGWGININLIDFLNSTGPMFCCGRVASNDTCMAATKGSNAPFYIEAGRVIFNRTSGSTSPNNTNDAPVTVTVTATVSATASASNSPSNHITLSSSSGKDAAIGAGMSGLLGLALFITLGFLWRQRRQKQSLRQDVETWEGRHAKLMEIRTVDLGGNEHQTRHLLDSLNSDGLYGQEHRTHEFQGWRPDEVDGTQVYEMANRKVGA